MPRYFTVDEANALLPRLTTLLQTMIAARERIITDRPNWEPVIEKAHTNGGSERAKNLYRDSSAIQALLNEINQWGVIIKDLDTGLVDFPHLRDGREVFLCWRIDEPRVAYWHDVDAGFAGRQPL
jgi:hypothetical protein